MSTEVFVESKEVVPQGHFTSKYALEEIVELKQKGAEHFMAKVMGVVFEVNQKSPLYVLRRPDGIIVHTNEEELCIRGVDYEVDESLSDEASGD